MTIDLKSLRKASPTPEQVSVIRDAPLEYLPYFIEWGQSGWEQMTRQMLEDEMGIESIRGKRVMDLGSRYGKMATLFGLLGAEVVGIDHNDLFQESAEEEAARFGVADRVQFVTGDALEYFTSGEQKFDVIFMKSLLTVIPTPLEEIVPAIAASLSEDGGRIVAVENGKGSFLYNFMRRFGSKANANWRKWTYFDKALVDFVGGHFADFRVRYLPFPPVYGMIGRRK